MVLAVAVTQCHNDKISPLLLGTRGWEESDHFSCRSHLAFQSRVSPTFSTASEHKILRPKEAGGRSLLGCPSPTPIQGRKQAAQSLWGSRGLPPHPILTPNSTSPPFFQDHIPPALQILCSFSNVSIIWFLPSSYLKTPLSSAESPVASSGGCTATSELCPRW